MRLTIIAGLILGTSLAVQSMLTAHTKAKAAHTVKAVGVHARIVAPWYIAMSDRKTPLPIATPGFGSITPS